MTLVQLINRLVDLETEFGPEVASKAPLVLWDETLMEHRDVTGAAVTQMNTGSIEIHLTHKRK